MRSVCLVAPGLVWRAARHELGLLLGAAVMHTVRAARGCLPREVRWGARERRG